MNNVLTWQKIAADAARTEFDKLLALERATAEAGSEESSLSDNCLALRPAWRPANRVTTKTLSRRGQLSTEDKALLALPFCKQRTAGMAVNY